MWFDRFVLFLFCVAPIITTPTTWLYREDGTGYVSVLPNETIKYSIDCATKHIHSNAETYNNPCCLDYLHSCYSKPPGNEINVNMNKQKCNKPARMSYEQQLCKILYDICKDTPNDQSLCFMERNKRLLDNPFTQPIQMLKDTYINNPYEYGTFSVDVKTIGMKNGTRGWGLWNTQLENTRFIWFFYVDDPHLEAWLNGFYVMIFDENNQILQKINDLDTNWHNYQIVWSSHSVMFLVDSYVVYRNETITFPGHLSYHVWVDNVTYGLLKNSLVNLHEHIHMKFNEINEPQIIWMTNFTYLEK